VSGSATPALLAVPNFSEGRNGGVMGAIGDALGAEAGARLLDVHRDADHNRSVFTLAGRPGTLSAALVRGARTALGHVSIPAHEGVHPRVGVLDVAPIVHLHSADRGAACAEALVLGEELGRELGLPVLLYGALASGRTRADLRRGGPVGLAERLGTGELYPDFGPSELHPRGGAVLVGARPPLVAFNLELAPPAGLANARDIAARVREGGTEGLPGVRAIGLELASRGVAQVSFNVESPAATPLAALVEAVGRHAEVAAAELVGLAPEVAFEGFPREIPMPGFDPERHVIERVLSH
jgi:glutamate formiminotransferase/glutamate formiminotransferase/formiminotetrahydrofolate cyclodeaminase